MAEEKFNVGWIGLGNAGYPMAACLGKKEYRLIVQDADPARGSKFVEDYLNQHPELVRYRNGRPILHYALVPFATKSGTMKLASAQTAMVQLLLSYGSNPSAKRSSKNGDGSTVWHNFLAMCRDAPHQNSLELAGILLEHGADPEVSDILDYLKDCPETKDYSKLEFRKVLQKAMISKSDSSALDKLPEFVTTPPRRRWGRGIPFLA